MTLATIVLAVVITLDAADVTGRWPAEFDTRIGRQKYLYPLSADGDKDGLMNVSQQFHAALVEKRSHTSGTSIPADMNGRSGKMVSTCCHSCCSVEAVGRRPTGSDPKAEPPASAESPAGFRGVPPGG
jgi:hypothetical protein